jgi:DNA-directed RNA polymerase subunit beta'
MPKILNYQEFCKDLPEVTSIKIIGKKYFHPQGLFSEQIFGPLKNYTCQCGTYYGISKSGGQCDLCKVDILNSNIRRTRFAKIVLPMPVVNPLFYDLLVYIGGKTLKTAIDDLMKMEKSVLYQDGEDMVVTVNPEYIPQGTTTWEKTDAILKLIHFIAKREAEHGVEEWQLVLDNIDNLLINYVIVLPPELRPTMLAGGKNKQLMDKINRYYTQILTKKEIIRETVLNIHQDKDLYYTYFKQIQKDVNELYTKILEKMAKKEGLIRGNILGKRIDFSGRAVIVPDPTLTLNECALPYYIILEIYKLQIAKKMIETGKFKLLNNAIDFVDKCIKLKSNVLYRICEDIIKGEVCILNRQPSLHRLSMLGFDIKLTLDTVIKIHPLSCFPFNADFDGDQMAVYIPITDKTKQEIREKIFITKNLYSPSNESLTTIPNQDIILGIYSLTNNSFDNLKEKVEYKNHQLTQAQKIFNLCLPDDYPVIDTIVDKKILIEILNDINDKYENEKVVETLDKIKMIGFKYATLFGCTMSLDDCKFEDSSNFRDKLYSGDIRNQLVNVSDKKLSIELRKHFKYSYMIDSGARGSWDQVKQLILTRGFISNFSGEILPLPIKRNLIDGLDQEEFFYSTYGCRKGLLDIALNTGTSGYLSRKLIFTCTNLQLSRTIEDCGTTDHLEVDVDTKRKAYMLIGRWMKQKDGTHSLIQKNNCIPLIGKRILIRSPILCTSPNICHKCYGASHKTIKSRFIGIIAAQTLGERATQLVLRTFHTSGSAVIKNAQDNNMKQQDIVGDLSAITGILHKFANTNYTEIVSNLFHVYDKSIYHVHYECVVSQLMWSGHKKWRLLSERDKIEPEYYSIQSVPNKESWILAMAFSNPKRSIRQGILYKGMYSGVMDKILKGEKIE